MVSLNGQGGSESGTPRHNRLEGSGGPVVDVTLGSMQASLKSDAIFAEVVEHAGKAALVFCSK